MTDERPNAIFNIGSQQGNVTNVGGDMTVYGGQHYTALPVDMIRAGDRKYSQDHFGNGSKSGCRRRSCQRFWRTPAANSASPTVTPKGWHGQSSVLPSY